MNNGRGEFLGVLLTVRVYIGNGVNEVCGICLEEDPQQKVMLILYWPDNCLKPMEEAGWRDVLSLEQLNSVIHHVSW